MYFLSMRLNAHKIRSNSSFQYPRKSSLEPAGVRLPHFRGPWPIKSRSFSFPFPGVAYPCCRKIPRTQLQGPPGASRVNATTGHVPGHSPQLMHSGFLESSVFPSPDPEPLIPGLDKAPGDHRAAWGLELDCPGFESQLRSLL